MEIWWNGTIQNSEQCNPVQICSHETTFNSDYLRPEQRWTKALRECFRMRTIEDTCFVHSALGDVGSTGLLCHTFLQNNAAESPLASLGWPMAGSSCSLKILAPQLPWQDALLSLLSILLANVSYCFFPCGCAWCSISQICFKCILVFNSCSYTCEAWVSIVIINRSIAEKQQSWPSFFESNKLFHMFSCWEWKKTLSCSAPHLPHLPWNFKALGGKRSAIRHRRPLASIGWPVDKIRWRPAVRLQWWCTQGLLETSHPAWTAPTCQWRPEAWQCVARRRVPLGHSAVSWQNDKIFKLSCKKNKNNIRTTLISWWHTRDGRNCCWPVAVVPKCWTSAGHERFLCLQPNHNMQHWKVNPRHVQIVMRASPCFPA